MCYAKIMIIKFEFETLSLWIHYMKITFKAQNSNNKSPFVFIDGSNEHLLLGVFQNITVADNTWIHDAR